MKKKTTSLSNIFRMGKIDNIKYPQVARLAETIELPCPHNMNVESVFSTMKDVESMYQNRISSLTYDSVRLVRSYFDRDHFEDFVPPPTLLQSIKESRAVYNKASVEDALRTKKRKTKHLL
jgi:hypothetical protein